ncbi:MAG: D-alanine-D-alanine ligase, partial [Mycobacterium sp.]|nr:D-alanine-D-alanine ligase [Mycobacterium sp.]
MASPSRLSVLHLVGSAVDDFHADLSRLYARACLDALADTHRYDVQVAYVSPDGLWRFAEELSADALRSATPLPISEAIVHLRSLRVDVVVPQMFCILGMTSYRRLLGAL